MNSLPWSRTSLPLKLICILNQDNGDVINTRFNPIWRYDPDKVSRCSSHLIPGVLSESIRCIICGISRPTALPSLNYGYHIIISVPNLPTTKLATPLSRSKQAREFQSKATKNPLLLGSNNACQSLSLPSHTKEEWLKDGCEILNALITQLISDAQIQSHRA